VTSDWILVVIIVVVPLAAVWRSGIPTIYWE
jgi:hypothetical protein